MLALVGKNKQKDLLSICGEEEDEKESKRDIRRSFS